MEYGRTAQYYRNWYWCAERLEPLVLSSSVLLVPRDHYFVFEPYLDVISRRKKTYILYFQKYKENKLTVHFRPGVIVLLPFHLLLLAGGFGWTRWRAFADLYELCPVAYLGTKFSSLEYKKKRRKGLAVIQCHINSLHACWCGIRIMIRILMGHIHTFIKRDTLYQIEPLYIIFFGPPVVL